MGVPQGKGMYIWKLGRIGTPSDVAKRAVEAKLDWVAIKMQNGIVATDGSVTSLFEAEQPDKYVSEIRAAGVRVHGWGYVYGKTLSQADAEVAAILRAVDRFKPDSWCINAEGEYKQEYTTEKIAKHFASTLKSKLPGVPIGYTTYRYPSFHPTFNWSAFNSYCDFASPQVYWVEAYNPTYQMQRCYDEYRKMTSMPIVPIGCAYPAGGWEPTPAQMDSFYAKVVELNCLGWSWWEWMYAWNKQSWWTAISKHGSHVVESPTLDVQATLLNHEARIKALESK